MFIQPAKDHHKLICYYYDAGRNPRLVIRPVKVEVMYPDPKIYVLREVISEKEMARLRELAAPIVSVCGYCTCTFMYLWFVRQLIPVTVGQVLIARFF